VVILAAGLDARAWRLPWPGGTKVYELDQPKVLKLKSSTLAQAGAKPTAIQVYVPVDLRHDWPNTLQQSGFDASAPSAWSAEGLLPFLPARAQDALFENITGLSAFGSRVAAEAFARDFHTPERMVRQREQMQRFRAAAAKLRGTEIPDFEDLWYVEERSDVAEWLRGHGWGVSAIAAADLMARYGRTAPTDVEDTFPPSVFVTAERDEN
jgi:methyltransferase (TIGR00027 family)